jgi:putative sterol carrier protein
MPKYLDQDWQDQIQKLSQSLPQLPGISVRVQYTVTGGPDGDIDYYWAVEDGRISEASVGTTEDPDLGMTLAYDVSKSIQEGKLDASRAYMQNKLTVTGGLAKMMRLLPVTNSPSWKAYQKEVRNITEY